MKQLNSMIIFGGFILKTILLDIVFSLDSVITAQIALAALAFVPPVLSELRDRQTLSVYRAMRLRK